MLHIGALADVCGSAGADEVSVRLTDFTGKLGQHVEDISERVATQGITPKYRPQKGVSRSSSTIAWYERSVAVSHMTTSL